MLTCTFCHFPGVGEKTEQALWAAGITSWEHMLQTTARPLKPSWTCHAQASLDHYQRRNLGFFYDGLPVRSHWRLFQDFQHCCAFLDIETTGMSALDEITTIALYDGTTTRHYVNGHNLPDFLRDVQEYRLLVTYNGKCFDVPFIERYFGTRLRQPHIDLRHTLASLGIQGGLKRCEQQLGLQRPGLEDVDGFVAVLLWQDYRRHHNIKALETLLAYNVQDAVNLRTLMIHAHNRKVEQTPFFGSHRLEPCSTPAVPFQPDRQTVERLTRRFYGSATVF
jgi:uncharacterized protein YprB with RNaseH-like and TPR domain